MDQERVAGEQKSNGIWQMSEVRCGKPVKAFVFIVDAGSFLSPAKPSLYCYGVFTMPSALFANGFASAPSDRFERSDG